MLRAGYGEFAVETVCFRGELLTMGRYTDPAIRSYAFTFDEVDGQSNHSGPESVSGSDTDRASAEVGRLYLRTPEHVPSIPSSFRPQCDDAAKSNNA